MAVDIEGFFLPRDVIPLDNSVNAFMSMGLVKLRGKEYAPLRATYIGGEEYTVLGITYRRRMGEPRFDGAGNPLYLMRRELAVANNSCTIRRGRDTSFPFKWKYANGEPFSSGTRDIGNETYNHFLYGTSRAIIGTTPLSNDDAGEAMEYLDYFEMKPYYASSSVLVRDSDDNIIANHFIGISPQWWSLTTDPNQAQLDYDFAYCPDLEWAEALVPGEIAECQEKVALFQAFAVDEFGQPLYEYVRDELGNLVLDNNNNPIPAIDSGGRPIRVKIFNAFRYYEITPPDAYRTAIDGQPSVEMYVGTEEVINLISGDSIDPEVDLDIPITPLQRVMNYVRPEDVVSPDYELVYAALRDNKASAEIVNPLAVVSDLQTDRNGHLTKRLRALWYKKDNEDRRYPMLFEVDTLPYGYCIEVGNIQHYYGTEHDQCAPHNLREEYAIERVDRSRGKKGKTLQLTQTKCFKHRLQVPVLVRQ
jgi:hypothetical protein